MTQSAHLPAPPCASEHAVVRARTPSGASNAARRAGHLLPAPGPGPAVAPAAPSEASGLVAVDTFASVAPGTFAAAGPALAVAASFAAAASVAAAAAASSAAVVASPPPPSPAAAAATSPVPAAASPAAVVSSAPVSGARTQNSLLSAMCHGHGHRQPSCPGQSAVRKGRGQRELAQKHLGALPGGV